MSTSPLRPTPGIPLAIENSGTLRLDGQADARLRAVVAAHFEVLWRSLRRFGVPESTLDDAVQHVLLTLANRLSEVELGRERAFLLATALRTAANVRRRHQRSREMATEELEHATGGATPESLLEEKRRRLLLDRALDTLPLEQRAVFVLYELEGFTLPEIAQDLGVPLGTATSRLRRARSRFEAWVAARNEGGERS
jgi:RNA polymerase sigma-70 factor, ECF subfamily